MKSDYSYWMSIPTRWRDVDSMQHVNSAVYFTYFEIVRMQFFSEVDLPKHKVTGKVGPAVISQTCNYRQQVFHPAVLEAGIRVTDLREKTFAVDYEFYLENTDTLVCDGTTVMVWVDYVRAKSIPLPVGLRTAIAAYVGG